MLQSPCPAYFPKVRIRLGGRALNFPETLKRWHSRWAAIHKVRSLDKHQRGELARDLAVSGPSDGVAEIAGGLLVRAVSGPAPKANANDKTLTLTLKPGETAVLGYSFR